MEQAGLPLLDTRTSDIVGIPLSDVERIATKDLRCLNPCKSSVILKMIRKTILTMRSKQDTDLDLAIHPIIINQTQALPEARFPSFYAEFRVKHQRDYSPQGQYNDSETIPPEVTLQMSIAVAGASNIPTVSCSRTVMLRDHRQLQQRPQNRCITGGSQLKSEGLRHATKQPINSPVKKRNGLRKSRNGPQSLMDTSQRLVSSGSNHGEPQQKRKGAQRDHVD